MGHNRGDLFEQIVIAANRNYEDRMIAHIQKIATPMRARRNAAGEVAGCYYESKSTVDFIGVYKSRAIAFDAKTTEDLKLFPLKNWKKHQVEFMQKWQCLGGISFSLLWLQEKNKYYILPQDLLLQYWTAHEENPKKRGCGSIPFEVIYKKCIEVKQGKGIMIDYLGCIDKWL